MNTANSGNHEGALARRLAMIVFCITATATEAGAQDVSAVPDGPMRQYQFERADGGYRLALRDAPMPAVGDHDVLLRVKAVSLNRRDWYMLNRAYDPENSMAGTIPLSDGAGEVIAVGGSVTRFRVGDRVAGTFFEEWIDGPPSEAALLTDRGGNGSGLLTEYMATHEDGLVSIPEHLSYEEAATLPCAALTAWVSLFKRGGLQPGQFVLLEGTGGVSLFGLIFSAAAGARPIITSSRDGKLERARSLGAFATVNYRKNPDWHRLVRELTGGSGVDQILDVGGRETLGKALEALAHGGHIALIGGLSGYGSDIPSDSLMWINATASGVYVGSRKDFEAMNEFITRHGIRPHIDRVFDFRNAQEAFDYMGDSDFVGKIVIRM
jgi:NADPH:quinone reductase-like Zn-dependent oxidoreductase